MRKLPETPMRAWLCLLGVACCSSLAAEEVRLKNGDVIYGDVVSVDAKNLTLKSENLGEVSIDRDRVISIRFAEPAGSGAWRVPTAATPGTYAPHATLAPVYSMPYQTPPTDVIRPDVPVPYSIPRAAFESPQSLPNKRPSPREEALQPPDTDEAQAKIERLKSRLQDIERQLRENKDLDADARERLSREAGKLPSEILNLISEADEDSEQRMTEIIKKQLGIAGKPAASDPKPKSVRVSIAGPGEVLVGSTVDYSVELKNAGSEPLRDLKVSVKHPESLVTNAATQGFEFASGAILWKIDELRAGARLRRRINFKTIKTDRVAIEVVVEGDAAIQAQDTALTHIIGEKAKP